MARIVSNSLTTASDVCWLQVSENPWGREGCWEESGGWGTIGRATPTKKPEKLRGAADFLLREMREGLDTSPGKEH